MRTITEIKSPQLDRITRTATSPFSLRVITLWATMKKITDKIDKNTKSKTSSLTSRNSYKNSNKNSSNINILSSKSSFNYKFRKTSFPPIINLSNKMNNMNLSNLKLTKSSDSSAAINSFINSESHSSSAKDHQNSMYHHHHNHNNGGKSTITSRGLSNSMRVTTSGSSNHHHRVPSTNRGSKDNLLNSSNSNIIDPNTGLHHINTSTALSNKRSLDRNRSSYHGNTAHSSHRQIKVSSSLSNNNNHNSRRNSSKPNLNNLPPTGQNQVQNTNINNGNGSPSSKTSSRQGSRSNLLLAKQPSFSNTNRSLFLEEESINMSKIIIPLLERLKSDRLRGGPNSLLNNNNNNNNINGLNSSNSIKRSLSRSESLENQNKTRQYMDTLRLKFEIAEKHIPGIADKIIERVAQKLIYESMCCND